MNKKRITYIGCMFIMLLLIGKGIVFAATNHINEMNTQDPIIPAKALCDAFKNEETADKYRQKTVTIKGFAIYIGPDIYALPSIELSEKKDGESRTMCVFDFSDYLKIRKATKGKEITIKGEARGLYDGRTVVMKHCEIIH